MRVLKILTALTCLGIVGYIEQGQLSKLFAIVYTDSYALLSIAIVGLVLAVSLLLGESKLQGLIHGAFLGILLLSYLYGIKGEFAIFEQNQGETSKHLDSKIENLLGKKQNLKNPVACYRPKDPDLLPEFESCLRKRDREEKRIEETRKDLAIEIDRARKELEENWDKKPDVTIPAIKGLVGLLMSILFFLVTYASCIILHREISGQKAEEEIPALDIPEIEVPKESRILGLIEQGLSYREIAKLEGVSPATVSNIKKRFGGNHE